MFATFTTPYPIGLLLLQLARLNELEDTVLQQDNQIAALSERIRSLQADVEKWRQREEHTTVTMSKEKERLIEGELLYYRSMEL